MSQWDYVIAELPLAGGFLGIAPMPGRRGTFGSDLNVILRWGADAVLSMTPLAELQHAGADTIAEDLAMAGVAWWHLPVTDFGAPSPEVEANWQEASKQALATLNDGGRVFTHCYGGCGRAGMAALRLMVEAGEDAEAALSRLRKVRPCAVQTEGQFAWAALPQQEGGALDRT